MEANAWRHTSDHIAEMGQNGRRNELDGIERAPGHFEIADLDGESDPIGHRPALNHD